MSSYESIVAFTKRCKTLERLDMAVLNAGAFKASFTTNPATKHEEVMQVNHLSTALLTILLIPVLRDLRAPDSSTPARIVLVNSETAAWAKFSQRDAAGILDAMDSPTASYDMAETYYASKLLNQLFFAQLARRVPATAGAVVTMENPGLCHGSELHRDISGVKATIATRMKRLIGRTLEQGAWTLTDAAVMHGEEVHGQYLGDCVIKP